MKKNTVLVVALFALMAVGVSAQTGTAGLEYKLLADGKAYSVSQGTVKNDVVIPATYNNLPVTTIADSGFSSTSSAVTSVIIPNSVTTIGIAAFQGCPHLQSVTIGSGVTKIGQMAFERCASLTSVTFQGTITSANFDSTMPFNGDLRNKYLSAGGGIGTYTMDMSNKTWTKQGATTTAPAAAGTPGLEYKLLADGKAYSVSKGTVKQGTVVIPASYDNKPVTTIANIAFKNTAITSITIPNSVISIGTSAFQNCTELASVTIPNSVTSIGNYAFIDCGLTSVTIPNSVTSIGEGAFDGCTRLTSVTIPNSVKTIGKQAFDNCNSLNSVAFQGTIPSGSFGADAFLGDLRTKFYATDKTNGTAGTYTRPNGTSTTWTKK